MIKYETYDAIEEIFFQANLPWDIYLNCILTVQEALYEH
jgi:hypothetical protein